MSFAKYFEDNQEILQERILLQSYLPRMATRSEITIRVSTPAPRPIIQPILYTGTCKCCGCQFTMTPKELAWFWKKGLNTPKRCRPCRKGEGKERR